MDIYILECNHELTQKKNNVKFVCHKMYCLPMLKTKIGTSNAYVVFTLTMLDNDSKGSIFLGIEKLYE